MKNTVNWGIISCARIADRAVIPGILGAKNARLYAVSSKSEERLSAFVQKYNPAKAYKSYEELLDDPDVDAVYIPLPNGLHCEWVVKAAEKKKHVLCEKPLGVTAEEVVRMKAACDQNGVLLMEAFAYLHSPLTLKVKELVDKGQIGKVCYIQSHFTYLLNDRSDVRVNKSLFGGATYDIGCYNISLIRTIAGEPSSIIATGEVGESGVDESTCLLMRFENGITAVSHCSFNCSPWSEYTIIGEDGAIDVPVQFNTKGEVRIILKKANECEEIVFDCPDNYMLEVEQFGRCILNGEAPLVSHEFSIGNAKVIDETLRQVLKR